MNNLRDFFATAALPDTITSTNKRIMQYNTTDFLHAITRELAKRSETYPRIVKKKQKQWADQGLNVQQYTINLTTQQRIQFELLAECKTLLATSGSLYLRVRIEIFRELQRELRMRKQCYPRWIHFGRMNSESAFYEIEVWTQLTKYFHEVYCPYEPWRKLPTRTKTPSSAP